MKKQTPLEKIASCKALQGKTVADVCELSGFASNLMAYVEAQREDYRALLEHAEFRSQGGQKFRPKAHPIAKTIDWSAERWKGEAISVIARESDLPAGIREYVRQVAMQAYNVTIANIVILEYPELREYFFGKSKVV